MAADVHALSGAFALDAIEPLERARFEAHLADCPTCQTEVAALQDTAAVLATLSAVQLPFLGLRRRLLAVIHRTPQLRPRGAAVPLPPVPVPRLARWLAIAAVGVVAVSAGLVAFDRDAGQERGRITADTVFSSSDVQSRKIQLDEGAFTVATSRQVGLLAVEAEMPSLPSGRVYQLWVITDAARSLALLEDEQGITTIPRRGRLAVTDEPAGGSAQPTTVPLFAIGVTEFDTA